MRGRDNGLSDYNTVRRSVGLPPITNWSQINPELYTERPEVIFDEERIERFFKGALQAIEL